jgi:putative ABC transport system permease protein
MFVTTMDNPRACPNALVERLRALRGVRQAMCSGDVFLKGNMGISWYATPTTPAAVVPMQIDPALFSFYGVKAVIGDLADAQHGIVLNQAAVKLLGFASPADAIGKSWMKPQSLREVWQPEGPIAAPDAPQSRVVAVVEDFGFEPVSQAVRPAIFSAQLTGTRSRLVHVRLTGDAVPQTLAAIDRLWRLTGQTSTPDRFFLDDYMKQQYVDIERQAQLFTLISAIAIFMACLGLVGIAAATADRRTKEVGVRKAMGATTSRIVGLMLWQFSLPVLLGSLVAWPLAFWLMQRWLAGFAYHTDLQWWMFAAASLGALLVALLTVAGQAWLAARQKPVLALRYE